MRHRKSGIKLGRTASHRRAMFRNMVTSLFKHERIQTTDAKAKELRGWADHIITLAKRGDLHARRQAMAIIREKTVVHKLFEDAGKRFGSVSGGYTRIIKLGPRNGDAAPMSLVELVSPEAAAPKTKKKKTAKPAAKKTAAPRKTKAAEKSPEKEADKHTKEASQASEPSAEEPAPETSDEAEKKVEASSENGEESGAEAAEAEDEVSEDPAADESEASEEEKKDPDK